MKNLKSQFVTRDDLLNLLSDEEVAIVSTAETAGKLLENDEYLDLERLDQGVQKAGEKALKMGSVLPKRAVRTETWGRILARLEAPAIGNAGVGA